MKNLFEEKDKKKFAKIKLIVLDTDGVIVPFGTKISETKDSVKMMLKRPSSEFYDLVRKLEKKYKILISSGRSMLTLRTMFSDLTIDGVYLQCENGARTFSLGESFETFSPGKRYYVKLYEILKEVRKLQEKNKKVVAVEPKETIVTVHCKKKLKEI